MFVQRTIYTSSSKRASSSNHASICKLTTDLSLQEKVLALMTSSTQRSGCFFLLIRAVWLTPVLHEASKLISSFSSEKPENCSTFPPSQRFRVNFTKLVEKSGLSFALFSKMSVWCLPGFISQNSQVPSPQLLKQSCKSFPFILRASRDASCLEWFSHPQ